VQLAYYDESGDDGYPQYSSPFFVLTALYLHYMNWRQSFDAIHRFRRQLKRDYGLPVNTEMHARRFLLNKRPYRALGLSDSTRLDIFGLFCDLTANLDARIVNVVIVKPRVSHVGYRVLDTALTYSIQRIENDLQPRLHPENRFLIITDTGRVGKMRATSRRIQRINFIPSQFGPTSYRSEIKSLIEDPLPKDSKESYFIQLADLVSWVVYLHSIDQTGISQYSNRLAPLISASLVVDWLERLRPSLNTAASRDDPYGIVYHPKK
jgi:hypothetical protein